MYVNQNYHTLTSSMERTMKDWNKLSASEMAARDADTFKIAERIYEMYFSKVYHPFYSLTMLITFLLYFLKSLVIQLYIPRNIGKKVSLNPCWVNTFKTATFEVNDEWACTLIYFILYNSDGGDDNNCDDS